MSPGSAWTVSRPPSASTRSRSRSRASSEIASRSPRSRPRLRRRALRPRPHRDGRLRRPRSARAPRDSRSTRRRDLGRVARARLDLDAGRCAGAHRRRPERGAEAARLEQRRVDPLRELRRLVQGLLHVAPHLLEERLRRAGSVSASWRASCRLTASATRCCCSARGGRARRCGGRRRQPGRAALGTRAAPRSRGAAGRATPAASRRANSRVIDLLLEDSGSCPSWNGRRQVAQHPEGGVAACRRSRLPPP